MRNRVFAVLILPAILAGCSESISSPTDAEMQAAASSGVSNAADAAARTYEVTIENLTSGQPLSPGIVATHTREEHAFQVGEFASEGIRLIAETGTPATAVDELSAVAGVDDVVATGRPVGCVGCPGPFASTMTFDIDARANANRLSLALMLICTNDGFAGLDGVRLPGGFKPATYMAAAYDAGTEMNDELSSSIVDPCHLFGPVPLWADGDSRTATFDPISHHPGIQGVGDLSAAHDWTDPVARITVRRIN
jgi:hypothetical protein